VTMEIRAKVILCDHPGQDGFGVHFRRVTAETEHQPCDYRMTDLGRLVGAALVDGPEHVGLG